MRILALSPRQCWPPHSGAKLREYYFLQALGQICELTLVHFAGPDGEPPTRRDLPFCAEVFSVPKPDAYSPSRLVKGLAGKWPLPVCNFTSTEMGRLVGRLVHEKKFDALHVEAVHLIRHAQDFAQLVPSAKVFYNWHNIESEAMDRYRATTDSRARKWYAAVTAGKLRRTEREILQGADGHVVCSGREREQLVDWVPGTRVTVVENGVDCGYFGEAKGPMGEHPRLVFVGSMDYHPNIDGAVWFAKTVWPELRRRIPDVELDIVGARPAPAVKDLGRVPGIRVTGTVPDVRPYYRGSIAAIVPLRTGGGTRLKILEAMAAGIPVVSTPLGAEGLEVNPGKDYLAAEADSPQAWIQHLAALHEHFPLREELSNAGLTLTLERYDWQILGKRLAGTYLEWLEQPS